MQTNWLDPGSLPGSITLSIAAAVVVAVLGWLVRPVRVWSGDLCARAIARLQSWANNMLGNEVVRVFANRRSLDAHLLKDFRVSSRIYLITGRGAQIQTEPPLTYLLNERNPSHHPVDVRVLLPTPHADADAIDWTAVNERAMRAIDPAYGEGTLSKQITAAYSAMITYKKNGKIEDVRLFNMPHFARIIVTDSGVYLTPYNEERISLRNKVLKFRKGGEMAKLFERLFRLLWSNAYPGGGA